MPSKLHIYCSHESIGPGDGRQLSKRLKVFNIKVGELTGDAQMTKQQISETNHSDDPEKYNVITCKMTETRTSYINLVRLIIIDEIHLLVDND